ncbi:hypothetical protein LTR36_001797 [Oleoguttula mirabilis]|uniref:Uncharacterized protein n=1 Tax=Oleoguttula mirabilis TaxID=1507867 RepID=A0AAV9JMK8_9PEZI|nr:hypothetical protein LTR36_001797 [Oleoguttula mirabilis]
MAYFLRKRLTRRQRSEELRAHTSDNVDSSGSSPAASETAPTAPSVGLTPGNISSTSPTPRLPTIRRVSPSNSILDRYKLRAPAAVAPLVFPAKVAVDHKTGRNTAFSEIFDTAISPLAVYPETAVRETADPIVVRGDDFELLKGPKDGVERTRSSVEVMQVMEGIEKMRIGAGEAPAPRRRLTRSQARRDSRADSARAGVEQEMVDTKDSATDLAVRKSSKSGRTELPRTPPTKNQTLRPDTMVGATPVNSPCDPSAQHLVSFCKKGTSITDDFPSPDAISPDPLATSSEYTESPSPAATETCLRDFSNASGAVTVMPPRYDPTRIPLHQWISTLGTNSRPEQPWGWMKVWTCCHCRAQTMLEQRDCARLECGHTRCHASCKVIRGGLKMEEATFA